MQFCIVSLVQILTVTLCNVSLLLLFCFCSVQAIMEICVADDLKKNILTKQDNADIRQCCDPPPDLLPGVACYYVKINCVSECIEVGNELPN